MARHKLQGIEILTGRTPWVTPKSLPKRFLSWLSELRYKGNKR